MITISSAMTISMPVSVMAIISVSTLVPVLSFFFSSPSVLVLMRTAASLSFIPPLPVIFSLFCFIFWRLGLGIWMITDGI